MKRHVCHIITGLFGGGADIMLYRLLRNTLSGPFTHSVISLTDIGSVGRQIRDNGIHVNALNMPRGFPDPRALFKLIFWLRNKRPHLIQTWMYHADMIGSLAARLAGDIPVVWGIHHATFDKKLEKKSTIFVADICAKLSKFLPRKIVCCSKTARKTHILRGYDQQKMVVIPNGFELNEFIPDMSAREEIRRELGLAENSIIIGLLGRFHPLKDHHNFINAAKELSRSYTNAHFLLCGNDITWDNKDLVAMIDQAGIHSRCHLLGARSDMPKIHACLDILTSSSCGEAFPLVIGEAMACGIPCVVTNVGDSAYIVGDTGEVVPPKDAHALVQAWKRLLALPPKERVQIGKKARKRIMENFGLESTARKYQALWESVME